MRPQILFPLFAELRGLPGVGPKLEPLFARAAGPVVADLLWHLPLGIVTRELIPALREAPDDRIITLKVRIDRHERPDSPRRPWRVVVSDASGFGYLIFFHAKADWLTKLMPEGSERLISGRVERYDQEIRIVHPDYVLPPSQASELPAIEPVYGLTAGLMPRVMRKAVAAALTRAPDLPEWQEPNWLKKQGWIGWHGALLAAHAPAGEGDLHPLHPVRQRLAYDELLASQLALALLRRHVSQQAGRARAGDGELRHRILAALPFALTGAQRRSVDEIAADLAAPRRMLRLLQGDVGSGKTIVALLAMAAAVEAGYQAAMMAPTEILARQHHERLTPLAAAAGLRVALLTGRDKGKSRQAILAALAAGEIDIIVGTHALFQEDVAFRNLGLAVIDEQHRFGVFQRLGLTRKGDAVDLLVMTATPIPRTLTLAAYGDMEISRLDEKPPGRRPIATRVLPANRLDEVVGSLPRAIAGGARVYWVCPLVAESETIDLAAAEARHAALAELFGDRVGLIHGRMKGPAKDKVMEAFAAGDLDILVATTVIEVGVDVPAATVMVIEHAERFGLAQLHQLRGRIGRGEAPSSCLLVYAGALGEAAKQRLNILRETEDGFRIAEEDLKLRGAGEVLGTRQSGLPDFRLADLSVHGELLAVARDDAKLILHHDPELATTRGQALRTLLYLFNHDERVRTLRSG